MFATITTVATVATVATAGARRTIFTGAGDIHGERSAIDIFAIERLDGRIRRFLGFHGDKPEAARAAGEFVLYHIHFHHRAMRGEEALDLLLGCIEGKISDVLLFPMP